MTQNPQELDFAAALASQEPFLGRLAKGMISDAQSAQDLAQETLLAAWTQATRPATSDGPSLAALPPARLRGWLSTVLRRKAVSVYRAPKTPSGLGPESAIPGNAPSPEQIAQRLESQAVLTEVLMGLPEEQRDAITLRFQDDLSVAAIAALRSASANTVKSRIHRGLKAMRDELDRRLGPANGGGRTSGIPPWLAAVTPLTRPFPLGAGTAGPSAAGAGATAAAPVFFGLLTLTLMKTALATLGAAIALGGAYWALSEPAHTSLAQLPTQATRSTVKAPEPLALPGPETGRQLVTPTTTKAVPTAAEGTGGDPQSAPLSGAPRTIRGRVLLVNSEPVPGVEVVARAEPTQRGKELARTKSKNDGSFELTFEGDDVPDSAHVVLDADSLAPSGCVLQSVALGENEANFRLDGLVVHLAPSPVPNADSSSPRGFLVVAASELTAKTKSSSYGRENYNFKTLIEEKRPIILSRGPAYSFNLILGNYGDDDQVAVLEKGLPAGIYRLQLSSDVPQLGSVTVKFAGAPLPEDLGDIIRVRLRPDSGLVGTGFGVGGSSETRRSGEFPGTYRVEASNDGDLPAGWLLASVAQDEITVRAGENTLVEVLLTRAGLCRFVTRQAARPGTTQSIREGEIIQSIILIRPVGEKRWSSGGVCEFDSSGKSQRLGFPKAGTPMVINKLLSPGAYEMRLAGGEWKTAIHTFQILPGQFQDITIDLLPDE